MLTSGLREKEKLTVNGNCRLEMPPAWPFGVPGPFGNSKMGKEREIGFSSIAVSVCVFSSGTRYALSSLPFVILLEGHANKDKPIVSTLKI